MTNEDWKLFRKCLPDWQEAFMERLLKEYAEIISGPEHASGRFWQLEKRLREDRRLAGVSMQVKRSTMEIELARLLHEGAITEADLEGFSEEVRGHVLSWNKFWT